MLGARARLLRTAERLPGELPALAELLAPYCRQHRATLLRGGGLALLLVALRLGQPWPLKWIVDGLTVERPSPAAGLFWSALFLALAGAAARVERRQVLTLAGVGNRMLSTLRADLFRHLLAQPLTLHERKGEGELLTRVVYDTTRVRKGVNSLLTRLLQTLLSFAAMVAVLFWVDVALGALVAAAGTAALWTMSRGGDGVRRAARRNRKREGRIASLIAGELSAVREVQTLRPELAGSEAFDRIKAKSLRQESRVQRIGAGMLFRVEVLVSAGVALVLLAGPHRVASGAISAGDLVLFVSYAVSLCRPFLQFARQATRLGATAASADRLRRLMRAAPPARSAPSVPGVFAVRGEIEFRNVGVRIPARQRVTRKWAVRDLCFRVDAGERVAVLGANGAGKSSLLHLLLGLIEPAEGEVRFDGHDARSYPVASLRRASSVVLQHSLLLGPTLRESLLLARPGATAEEVTDALRAVRALKLAERLPQGLDTPVRRQGRAFSAGERQRLVLARALIGRGTVWLLDEPTAGLDEAATRAAVAALEVATRGRTTLWTTRERPVADFFDRVLCLDRGRVSFFGTREEFLRWKDPGDDPADERSADVLTSTGAPR